MTEICGMAVEYCDEPGGFYKSDGYVSFTQWTNLYECELEKGHEGKHKRSTWEGTVLWDDDGNVLEAKGMVMIKHKGGINITARLNSSPRIAKWVKIE